MKKHSCIMVVDDAQSMLRMLSRALELEGYDVVAATDGITALALLEKYGPDLVILDVMMPGLDGFQVLGLIRQRSSVPVIMLTALSEVSTLRHALSLGADDCVRKPFRMREILARIRANLSHTGSLVANTGYTGNGAAGEMTIPPSSCQK